MKKRITIKLFHIVAILLVLCGILGTVVLYRHLDHISYREISSPTGDGMQTTEFIEMENEVCQVIIPQKKHLDSVSVRLCDDGIEYVPGEVLTASITDAEDILLAESDAQLIHAQEDGTLVFRFDVDVIPGASYYLAFHTRNLASPAPSLLVYDSSVTDCAQNGLYTFDGELRGDTKLVCKVVYAIPLSRIVNIVLFWIGWGICFSLLFLAGRFLAKKNRNKILFSFALKIPRWENSDQTTISVLGLLRVVVFMAAAIFGLLMLGGSIRPVHTNAVDASNVSGVTAPIENAPSIIQSFRADGDILERVIVRLDRSKMDSEEADSIWRSIAVVLMDDHGHMLNSVKRSLAYASEQDTISYPFHNDLVRGETYRLVFLMTPGGAEGPALKVEEATGTTNGYLTLTVREQEMVGLQIASDITYRNRIPLFMRFLFALLSVACGAIVCFLLRFMPKRLGEKRINGAKLLRVMCVGVAAIGMGILFWYTFVLRAFGGAPEDYAVYGIGLTSVAVYLLMGILFSNMPNPFAFFHMQREARVYSVKRIIRTVALTYAICQYCTYSSLGITYYHEICMARFCLGFGIFLLTFLTREEWMRKINRVYVPIHLCLFIGLAYMKPVENRMLTLYLTAVVWSLCWAIVLIQGIWSLVVRTRRIRISIPYAIVFAVLAVMMIVLRGKSDWQILFSIEALLLFLMVSNSEYKEDYLRDVANGMILTFLWFLVMTLLHRPFNRGYRRHPGFMVSEAAAGLFLLACFAAILSRTWDEYRKDSHFRHMWFYYLLLALSGAFAVLTLGRTTMVAMIAVLVIVLIVALLHRKVRKLYVLRFGMIVVCSVLLSLPGLYSLLRMVPALTNKPYYYLTEYWDEPLIVHLIQEDAPLDYTEYVTLERELSEVFSRVDQTFSNQTNTEQSSEEMQEEQSPSFDSSNGRIDIWKAYLASMNWFGHDTMVLETEDNYYFHAHNIILQQIYDYGWPVGLLFVVWGIWMFLRSVRLYLRSECDAVGTSFPLVSVVALAIAGMFELVFSGIMTLTVLVLLIQPIILLQEKKDR